MSTVAPTTPGHPPPQAPHPLQCMEIIGGNRALHTAVSSPGLDIWIHSRPLAGHAGGDLHYLSMCGSGRVTRFVVADISGHGPGMDHVARWLRGLMRKHINLLDQTRFARAINEEFTRRADANYFATVLLATYFAPTDHLIVCNAGHPRPVWFRAGMKKWELLDTGVPDPGPSLRQARGTYRMRPVANLPLGIVAPTDYIQFAVRLDRGDLVLIYTDALVEARDPNGTPLGETGLLDLARQIGPSDPQQFGNRLLDRISEYTGHADPQDDQTLLVLHHNASDPPPLTITQALRSLARMIGLRKV